MTTLRSGLRVLALAGVIAPLPAAAANSPPYGTVSVFVPFVNAAAMSDPAKYESPRIRVGFDEAHAVEKSFPVTMDTGSVGIVAGVNYFVPPTKGRDDDSFLGPGSETLTSSGVILTGDWYKTDVRLFNGATLVATSRVPVLAVHKVSCLPDARDCNITDPSGAGTHYFGIGFAGGAGQPQGTPDKNAFLNVTSVPGSSALPSPGYILTTQGAHIGLTAANTQGFALMKLEPVLAPNATQWLTPAANPSLLTDWQHTKAVITVNGKSGRGGILFDTGVSTAFLTPPPGVSPATGQGPDKAECNGSKPPACAVAGTRVSVAFPDAWAPVARLSYTVGPRNGSEPGNPISPFAVAVDHNGAPFLNTTVRFLQGFDYLYDAANGFTGLRSTGRAPAQHAASKPGSMTTSDAFACFFKWAAPGITGRGGWLLPTAYSWPYTYRTDPRKKVTIGVSSGSAASGDAPATKANEVYLLTTGTPSSDRGPLSGWVAAAGCQ